MRSVFRWPVAVLLLAVLLALLWVSLPLLVTRYAETRLQAMGYTDVVIELDALDHRHAVIRRLHLASPELQMTVQEAELSYRLDALFDGRFEALRLRRLDLVQTAGSDTRLPDVRLLAGLLAAQWQAKIPFERIDVEQLRLLDAGGNETLRLELNLRRHASGLLAEILIAAEDGAVRRLLASQTTASGLDLILETGVESTQPALHLALRPAPGETQLQGTLQADVDAIRASWPRLLAGYAGRLHGEFSLSAATDDGMPFMLDLQGDALRLAGWGATSLRMKAEGLAREQDDHLRIEVAKPLTLHTVGLTGPDTSLARLHLELQGELALSDTAARAMSFTLNLQADEPRLTDWNATSLRLRTEGHAREQDARLTIELARPLAVHVAGLTGPDASLADLQLEWPGTIHWQAPRLDLAPDPAASLRLDRLVTRDLVLSGATLRELAMQVDFDDVVSITAPRLRVEDLAIASGPAEVRIPAADVNVRHTLADGTTDFGASTANIAVTADDVAIGLRDCRLQLTAAVKTRARMACQYGAEPTPIEANLEAGDSSGRVRFATGVLQPSSQSPLIRSVMPAWNQPFDLVTGRIIITGDLSWSPAPASGPALRATIDISEAGGFYERVLFSGLQGRAELQLLPELRSLSPAAFSIAQVDIGVPVGNVRATAELSPVRDQPLPRLLLTSARLDLLGGQVSGEQIPIDLNSEQHAFQLDVDGLSLADVVALQQTEGLAASGRLDGRIPVRIDPAGLTVSDGRLAARAPGGYIRYAPAGGSQSLEQAAPGTEVVFKILDDLQYQSLEVKADYTVDGNLLLNLAIKGRSPKLERTRPVHINLNLEQNILTLLKSLRYVDGLNEALDKDVQAYFRRHMQPAP